MSQSNSNPRRRNRRKINKKNSDSEEEEEVYRELNNKFIFNEEAGILSANTGISYEDAVKYIEENAIIEKRNSEKKNTLNDQNSQKNSDILNSKNWEILSQLEPSILYAVINIMLEETIKAENNGGRHPALEFAISLAIDREKEERKEELIVKEEEEVEVEEEEEINRDDNEIKRKLILKALEKRKNIAEI